MPSGLHIIQRGRPSLFSAFRLTNLTLTPKTYHGHQSSPIPIHPTGQIPYSYNYLTFINQTTTTYHQTLILYNLIFPRRGLFCFVYFWAKRRPRFELLLCSALLIGIILHHWGSYWLTFDLYVCTSSPFYNTSIRQLRVPVRTTHSPKGEHAVLNITWG